MPPLLDSNVRGVQNTESEEEPKGKILNQDVIHKHLYEP